MVAITVAIRRDVLIALIIVEVLYFSNFDGLSLPISPRQTHLFKIAGMILYSRIHHHLRVAMVVLLVLLLEVLLLVINSDLVSD